MISTAISNGRGLQLSTLDYGARMVSLLFQDRDGRWIDVIAGYDDPVRYLSHGIYYGAICGRFANRIRHGRFLLGDQVVQLECNHTGHHLHGGEQGLHAQYWSVAEVRKDYVRYETTRPDGEMGYPGRLELGLSYHLETGGSLLISYSAKSDQDTVVNLASHGYFNLDGGDSIRDHELMIDAVNFLPIDEEAIPTCILQSVRHTPFDFQEFKPIGRDLKGNNDQLRNGRGYDHCFALRHPGALSRKAASLRSARSGIQMDLHTTQPGLQLYTCNWKDKTDVGKQNRIYREHQFVCLEAEHFPDSPNHPDFPSTVLRAGETYSHKTRLNFFRF